MNLIFKSLLIALSICINLNALGDGKFDTPKDANGIPQSAIEVFGAEVLTSTSSVGVVVTSASGVFYGFDPSTGTASTYIVCADTDTQFPAATDWTAGGNPAVKRLMQPRFFSPLYTSTTTPFTPPVPASFRSGLSCFISGADNSVTFYYKANGRY